MVCRCRVLPRVRPQPVYVISPQAFAAGGLTRGKTLHRRLAAAKSARFAAKSARFAAGGLTRGKTLQRRLATANPSQIVICTDNSSFFFLFLEPIYRVGGKRSSFLPTRFSQLVNSSTKQLHHHRHKPFGKRIAAKEKPHLQH